MFSSSELIESNEVKTYRELAPQSFLKLALDTMLYHIPRNSS